MSDALPLPARPNLEQYKKLAKELRHACQSVEAGAVRRWAARWSEALVRLQGQEQTPEDKRLAERIEHHWTQFQEKNEPASRCALSGAQLFIARSHGFESWPKFADHLQGLAAAQSTVSQFEAAADAIVTGDLARLQSLLRQNPQLASARSTRAHRSTLLHYVSANGVEDFRQKTPLNIVEIAETLLDAGADVNAESDAYGGRSTTLGLTATSYHPEAAGVQLALMALLIDRGAFIDGPDSGNAVTSCLHNGRGEAAEFLANRGAHLDLEGAAGLGKLDVVRSFFSDDGTLNQSATQKQLTDGFAWACQFGRIEVLRYLLRNGVPAGAGLARGATGLHWAAFKGHTEIVRLLLENGAPANAVEATYDGTPLAWALYGWGKTAEPRPYYEVVALLSRAGATVDAQWYEQDEDRSLAAARMRSDPQMLAALRGEMPAGAA